MVVATKKHLESLPVKVYSFGHIGDANLHLAVKLNQFDVSFYENLDHFVYEYASKLRGSISAEHGIGFFKPNCMKLSKSAKSVDLMREIKDRMDPFGILNPYKVFPKH